MVGAYVAFAMAAALAGWCIPALLARKLLEMRDISTDPSPRHLLAMRSACALMLAGYSFNALAKLQPPSALCVCGALMCVLVILLCDIWTRIAPWQACAVLCACAMSFRVLESGVMGLALCIVFAILFAGVFVACNFLTRRLSTGDAFGPGDLRAIPPLCVVTGINGSFIGLASCCAVSLIIAACLRFIAHDPDWRHIPMGPGFAAWLLVGTFA